MIRVRTLTAILAVSAIGFGACSKKDKDADSSQEPAAKTTAKTTAANASATAPTATPDEKAPVGKVVAPKEDAPASNIKIDAEVMAEIKKIAGACEIDVKGARIKCANKEDELLNRTYFGYGDTAKDRVATIGTLAVALSDADPKVQTVAAKTLGSSFSSGWPKAEVGSVEKEVSALLRKAIPTLGKYQSRTSIVATVYASSLSESDEELYGLLEGSTDDYLQSKGWGASMYYGRMKAFEKIQGLAATGEPAKILTAVTAASNMPKYLDEERTTVCPWAHGLLGADAEGAKESDVFEQAGWVLKKCSGEWVDKLLDWGEAQRAKNIFDRKYYFVYRELCHSFMAGVDKVGATQAQCDRNYKFLEKTANTKGIEPKFRAWALDSISYSRRDEKSFKLMKKYTKSKVPEIKKVAEDARKMLESYVKKK